MSQVIRMLASADITSPGDLAGVSMKAAFGYDPADPLAITVTFPGHTEGAAWTVSRDLLRDGLGGASRAAGSTAWVSEEDSRRYCLRVRSGSWSAIFTFRTREVARFLGQTYAAVPDGPRLSST